MTIEVTQVAAATQAQTHGEAQKRSIGSTSAAIMVLASMMRENRIEQAGAIDQIDAQNALIAVQTKELENLKDNDVLKGSSTAANQSYIDLQNSMTFLLQKKDVAQNSLETTATLHLRNPSQMNNALSKLGSSFNRLYQEYAKSRT